MRARLKNFSVLIFLLVFSGLTSAQGKNKVLSVTGEVENPTSYTLENIKSFPQLLITTNNNL